MKKGMLSLLMFTFLIVGVMPVSTQAAAKETHSANAISPAMVKLHDDLRKLWIDHTIWTHNYIVSAIAGLEDQQDVLERLLRNQQDIGNAIKPYYGEAAGNQLAELLREHILLAGKVVDAAKSGNQADLDKYNKEWFRNADDIAKFLSSANPNWSQKELQDMLHAHLTFITEQVTARLKKDWKAEILASDKGEDHMIMFADILTQGIIKQFPDKFK
ncbi:glycosyltransferase [Paenibacillus sp. 1001270B_150601_E10]|uniref:glycosyltransferase n=1 Tax=Paenibacillus sp. 1001270B_150601_E10 TaxID=2787079 RepID=UPI00189F5784